MEKTHLSFENQLYAINMNSPKKETIIFGGRVYNQQLYMPAS